MIFNYPRLRKELESMDVVFQLTHGCAFSGKKYGERYFKGFKDSAEVQVPRRHPHSAHGDHGSWR